MDGSQGSASVTKGNGHDLQKDLNYVEFKVFHVVHTYTNTHICTIVDSRSELADQVTSTKSSTYRSPSRTMTKIPGNQKLPVACTPMVIG